MNAVLNALQNRVSNPMRTLTKQTPSAEQWTEIFKAVASAPDYGGLLPYTFYVLQGDKRDAHIAALKQARLQVYPEHAEQIAMKMDIMQNNVGAFVFVTHTHNSDASPSAHDQMCATICAASHFYLALNTLNFGAVWITPTDEDRTRIAEKFHFAQNAFIAAMFMVGGIAKSVPKQRPHPEQFVHFV